VNHNAFLLAESRFQVRPHYLRSDTGFSASIFVWAGNGRGDLGKRSILPVSAGAADGRPLRIAGFASTAIPAPPHPRRAVWLWAPGRQALDAGEQKPPSPRARYSALNPAKNPGLSTARAQWRSEQGLGVVEPRFSCW